MTGTYWCPTAVIVGKLWPTLARCCEDAIRYTLLKGWWGCIFPQIDWHWDFKNGFNFELSLMDAEYRLSSSFAAFSGVLKVVGGIVHHISNSEASDFFIFDSVIGSWGELETRIYFLILWRFETWEEDTINSAVSSSLSLFSSITFSDGFLILLKKLFIFESGKMVLMLLFCIY